MKMMNFYKILHVITLVMLTSSSIVTHAANLGVIGHTYPIQEEDFLDFIKKHLTEMQTNGQLQQMQTLMNENVKKHIDRPLNLANVTRASQSRSWQFDPSVIVPNNLYDADGHLFAHAGSRVNPLTMITLHSSLVFFNGDDEAQVKWVLSLLKKHSNSLKLVLVNGSVSDQEKWFQLPIYFDQEGRLCHRFHIQHVPAIVKQEGDHLKISEVGI
jgi:conjugal transfer pilus assembly protein TraW